MLEATQDNTKLEPSRVGGHPHWYAAYTFPRHEKRVAEHLVGRGVEFFLPQYETVRRWKDRRVRLSLPLFPGYVFVHVPLGERLRVLASVYQSYQQRLGVVGRGLFELVWSAEQGLRSQKNTTSCFACHSQPASGGAGRAQS